MSDSLILISDEQAKLGQEALRALRALGSFFERALGSIPEDLIGYLVGDWLRTRRAENIARLLFTTKERLEAWGVSETQPATLSVAIPILQGAADEDREPLIVLWARLLAGAMDHTKPSVRYKFIEAVKRLDPIDAEVCDHIHREKLTTIWPGQSNRVSGPISDVYNVARAMLRRDDEIEMSIHHLRERNLLNYSDTANYWLVNSIFREFMRAVYPERQP